MTPTTGTHHLRHDAVRRLLRGRLTLLVAGTVTGLVLCLVAGAGLCLAMLGPSLQALASFAALAIPLAALAVWLIHRGITTVADELDRLAAQVGRLAADLGEGKRELETTQRRLLDAAHQAGMAEVAGEILHNVGNVLTSLNVTTAVLLDRVGHSAIDRVGALAERAAVDDRLRERLPTHLATLAGALHEERALLLRELGSLRGHLDHVAHIVRQQQPVTAAATLRDEVDLTALCEDAIDIACAGMNEAVSVTRQLAATGPLRTDRHRLLQILVNLLVNARRAVAEASQPTIHLSLAQTTDGVVLRIRDSGVGILPEHLPRLFDLGFTTRSDGRGHGYGLHASANAARLLGGRLSATSDGPGTGATFILELPALPSPDTRT
jgi:signal transduction histidine kinase